MDNYEHNTSDNNDAWQQVLPNKKRSHNFGKFPRNKQSTLNSYWLNKPIAIETENMYQPPQEINDIEMNNTSQPKTPPLITIYKVHNIIPLQDLLNKLVNTRYKIITLGINKIKLQLHKKEDLVTVTQVLDQNKTEYHTYKNKEDKTYRVVLRGLHSSSNNRPYQGRTNETRAWNYKHMEHTPQNY